MARALSILLRTIVALVLLAALGIVYLWWSNRDLPLATLEAEYGGNGLQWQHVDGVDIAYRVEGEGPPLVLLHSHFYTMRQWQDWVDTLASDFTLIRFDLTSHGLTGPDPSQVYSHERGAELLAGLLDHLGIERAALAGSSTGGALAYRFAAEHPARVNALVLINAPGMPRTSNKYMEAGMPGWMGYVFYLLPERLFKPFLEAAVVDNTLITDERVREFHRMYRREGNRWAEFLRMSEWSPHDIRPLLEKITAPVLLLWGEDNPQLPVEHVEQYREQLVNAARVDAITYPGIGHVIPIEAPLRSAEDTRAFLRSLK